MHTKNMEPHAVPRQITTFEFKLIGFLTLKQFLYLVFATGIALIVYYATPIPIFNFLFAGIVVFSGIALAFIPYNERPLDVWIRNFVKKLFSASQYFYMKKNSAPDFLKGVYITSQKTAINHLDAQNKLNKYLENNNISTNKEVNINQNINIKTEDLKNEETKQNIINNVGKPESETKINSNQPFVWGIIKNSKGNNLTNILVYIKNSQEKPIRILKTNTSGVFATFHPIPKGDYIFEIKDPNNSYFFDTIKINLTDSNNQPLNFVSKELL